MTTVPNLNIVVQQGSNALKALNTQNPSLDVSSLANAEQPEKEDLMRSTVQQLVEPERTPRIRKNITTEKRLSLTGTARKGKREPKEGNADSRGRLIDAYA